MTRDFITSPSFVARLWSFSLCLFPVRCWIGPQPFSRVASPPLYSSSWDGKDTSGDSSSSSSWESSINDESGDWQERLENQKDDSFWSSFGSSQDDADETKSKRAVSEEDGTDAWLETLASLSAKEVDFNQQEAERADKARQMEEWGFDRETIENAMGVQMDGSREASDEVEGMKMYREGSYLEEVDLQAVESHTKVEVDPETNEPVRTQMVYVDEHECIGCTNCAMIAQSTFYMNEEHGRARVFEQWGDDDETIQVAIETCPVDCIHYVPYDELKKLEIERRDQNINFKARLVSQAENGNNLSHRVGGAVQFSAQQKIRGNMASRCTNCPSRGCKDCPMYGVGKNPEFEKKEARRKALMAKRALQRKRESEQKSADL